MVADKPMKVSEKVKNHLDSKRKYPRESYNNILERELKLKSGKNK